MFTRTEIKVSKELFDTANINLPNIDFKLSLNKQTGRFLYDAWVIKPEFKGTVWEEILNTLPSPIGEARLVLLKPGTGYQSHADIDDRYHLNLSGDKYSYLINVDTQQMYPVCRDRFWYNMNAGPRHSAVNLGRIDRVQLLVRKLLDDVSLDKSVHVTIQAKGVNDSSRFLFDNIVSPWLNGAIKRKIVSGFEFNGTTATFNISVDYIREFECLDLSSFIVDQK